MKIEILGYLIIPLGIMLLFLDRKYLLYASMLFAGFTGSGIMTINEDLSIQPSYYLGILFCLKQLVVVIKNRKIIKPDKKMLIFIVFCLISLIMPKILESSNISIINQDGRMDFVKFTSSNITQTIYLMFCFIFYIFVKDYLKERKEDKINIIKMLIIGCVFVCILGVLQEIIFLTGVDFDFDSIFRTNVNGNVQTTAGFLRVYSTTIEPSMLAYYLVANLALVLSIENTQSKILNTLLIGLITVTGLLTTSTTFFMGLIILLGLVVFESLVIKNKDRKKKNYSIIKNIGIMILFILLTLLILYVVKPDLIKATINDIVNKLHAENTSGIERTDAIKQHIKAGLQSPVLGNGFGTARSKDLLTTWICNIGFIAVGIFIWYLFDLNIKLRENKNKLAYGASNYLIVLFICAFVSVPEVYNLFIWIMLAIGENIREKEYIEIGEKSEDINNE